MRKCPSFNILTRQTNMCSLKSSCINYCYEGECSTTRLIRFTKHKTTQQQLKASSLPCLHYKHAYWEIQKSQNRADRPTDNSEPTCGSLFGETRIARAVRILPASDSLSASETLLHLDRISELQDLPPLFLTTDIVVAAIVLSTLRQNINTKITAISIRTLGK